MSNASTGVDSTVIILMELNPLSVYRKARQLVSHHPEMAPLVTELIGTYGRVFDDLHDDFATIDQDRT